MVWKVSFTECPTGTLILNTYSGHICRKQVDSEAMTQWENQPQAGLHDNEAALLNAALLLVKTKHGLTEL